MNTTFLISLLPAFAIALSLFYIFKRPQQTKNLSRAMAIALLALCILGYFGNDIATKENKLFWSSFAILTIYCITVVPFLMHLTSAIRQRKKMALKENEEKNP